jgi:hypothetical protein
MLKKPKFEKMQAALKIYSKKYLQGNIVDLDESGTRLLVNTFLSEVLCFEPIAEIKTEYMIRGTYADYMVQIKGERHFLVEVKAFSLKLSENHLRQVVNYGANEGIEWVLLTNGKVFDFYKVLFTKPIASRKVFSIDFTDPLQFKKAAETLQFMHRDCVANNGLSALWSKITALEPTNVAGLLFAPTVINFIKKNLKDSYKRPFTDEEVKASINAIICKPIEIEGVKPFQVKKEKKKPAIVITSDAVSLVIPDGVHLN